MNPKEILSSKNLSKAKSMLSGIKNNLSVKTYSKLLDISFNQLRKKAIKSQEQVSEGTYRRRKQANLNEGLFGVSVAVLVLLIITVLIALLFGKKPRPEVKDFVNSFRKRVIGKATDIININYEMTRETKEYLFFYGISYLLYNVFQMLADKSGKYYKEIKQILNSDEYGFTRVERYEILNNIQTLYMATAQRLDIERQKIAESPDLEHKASLVESMVKRSDVIQLCDQFLNDLKVLGKILNSETKFNK